MNRNFLNLTTDKHVKITNAPRYIHRIKWEYRRPLFNWARRFLREVAKMLPLLRCIYTWYKLPSSTVCNILYIMLYYILKIITDIVIKFSLYIYNLIFHRDIYNNISIFILKNTTFSLYIYVYIYIHWIKNTTNLAEKNVELL